MLATIYAVAMSAQSVTQKGVTYRYNGKNKRTPVGGVYIKAVTADNGVVSDEQSGAFTLTLKELQMGSPIGSVRVTKQGMMIFNQQAVDEWHVRKEPLCLILCNADEFQKQKKNLIAIGESQAKKKYDKKLAELKRQNEAKQLKIDEYYNKLDSLEKEYQNALKHMDEYADVFARIDESEVDTVTQRAIELFNRGEIEESMRLLEQQNYMDKIIKANSTIEQADALISTAEQAKSLAEQDKEKYIEGVKTQIAGYKLQNEWDKAKALLKGLADNLNTLDAIWDYANFCYNQNDFNEAEAYFLKYEAKVRASENMSELEKLSAVATVQNDLAVLYSVTQRFAESEEMHKSALTIRERLAQANPHAYERDLVASYNNLAVLYQNTQRFSESEEMYKSALTIRERLAQANPQAYEPDLAISYSNLGVLYQDTQRFSESEEMQKSALTIRERLAQANPQAYEPDLAISYNNLGILYYKTQRFSESEEMYKSALTIHEQLAQANPQAYEPDLATSYNNLGSLYYNTQRFSESEEKLKSALAIRERLAQANPQAYEPDLAASYNNLAVLYQNTQRFSESETMYKAALTVHERLAQANPQAYEPDLAMSYHNLGNLYKDTQRFSESEDMYKAALKLYSQLFEGNPQNYEISLMKCYFRLGATMVILEKINEAKEPFKQSLQLARKQVKAGKETPLYSLLLNLLSYISAAENDYAFAYAYNEELLPLLNVQYQANAEIGREELQPQLISQSFYANLLGKFKEGEHYSLEALKVDSTNHHVYTNLAAAYLFQGKVKEAEKLYRQYKAELKDSFLSFFAEFERLGVIPEERKKDVERIKAMLNEE